MGIKKASSKEVVFGATDVAPSDQELDANKLILIPMFATGITPAFNLGQSSKTKLRLTGEVLAGIFSGDIKNWNASEIQELNPEVTMPAIPITPVVRSDGSGTTYYFTQYLSAVSSKWRQTSGVAYSVSWPGNFIGVKGSEAVTKRIKDTVGSIGYVDYTYAQSSKLSVATLKNSANAYVTPDTKSFRTALNASELATMGNLHAPLTNMPGLGSWPITMASYILVPRISDTPEETTKALKFISWALHNGDQVLEKLSFVRLPDIVQARAFRGIMLVKDNKGAMLGLQAANLQ